MSSLTSKANKKGKITWIDIEPFPAMTIIGLLAALLFPYLWRAMLILPFTLSLLGLAFLIIAKISLFRRGIWFSFGSQLMTRGYAKLYTLSYYLMGIGVLLLLMLFFLMKIRGY